MTVVIDDGVSNGATVISLPFQRLANLQGRRFHDECIMVLEMSGFEVVDQHVIVNDVGIEIDAITNNAQGVAIPWEFKGSWQGVRPGLLRTDTLKKAIANGYLLSQWEAAAMMMPLMVMASHIPESGHGAAMIRNTGRDIVADFINSRDSKKLRKLANSTEEQLRKMYGL
jgi:hypothetical protein